MLAERGIRVRYETVRRWVARFGVQYGEELRRREARRGRTWHMDEMAVRIGGKQHWLWRAVDEHGTTLDVLLQEHRHTDTAERFFRRLLGFAGGAPERITTDKLGSYAAAIRRLPQLKGVDHQEAHAALRCNNRVEQARQPTRVRERRMGRFRCPTSAHPRVSNLFRPGRHRLGAGVAERATGELRHLAAGRGAQCIPTPPLGRNPCARRALVPSSSRRCDRAPVCQAGVRLVYEAPRSAAIIVWRLRNAAIPRATGSGRCMCSR